MPPVVPPVVPLGAPPITPPGFAPDGDVGVAGVFGFNKSLIALPILSTAPDVGSLLSAFAANAPPPSVAANFAKSSRLEFDEDADDAGGLGKAMLPWPGLVIGVGAIAARADVGMS